MDTLELIQGSAEWKAARCGSLGASQIHDAMARTRSGWGASRANLRAQLVVERLTGNPTEGYTNVAMQWGTETEPQARAAYAFYRDVDVREVGLVRHPSIPGTHASPDGLIGTDGALELKCPNSATHIEYLTTGAVPDRYVLQALWQMECCGRQWCDVASFDPRMPERLRLWVKRIERDDTRLAQLRTDVSAFLDEVSQALAQLERVAA